MRAKDFEPCSFGEKVVTHGCGDKDGRFPIAEGFERFFPFPLVSVSVNACRSVSTVVEIVVQIVGALFGFGEDESERGSVRRIQKICQELDLVLFVHPNHFLGDVGRSGTDATYREENVTLQKVARQQLNFFRKGR